MSSVGDRTHRAVSGALSDAIRQHGPITEANQPSAVKRVVAQLRSAAEASRVLIPDGSESGAVEAAHKRYEKLRFGHQRLLERYDRLREHADEHAAEADRLRVALHRIAEGDYPEVFSAGGFAEAILRHQEVPSAFPSITQPSEAAQ